MNTLDDQRFPDPSEVSPRDTGIRYGVIMALAGVIMGALIYIMGGNDPANASTAGSLGCLSGIISIAIITMGIKTHRDKDLGGFISLGRGLTVSFWMGLVSGAISAVWNYVFTHFIAPETLEAGQEAIDQVRAQVEDGEVPEWVLTITESSANAGSNPLVVVISTLIFVMIIGFFASLFLKRDRPLG